jgi:hypothetical protein
MRTELSVKNEKAGFRSQPKPRRRRTYKKTFDIKFLNNCCRYCNSYSKNRHDEAC